MGCYKRLSVYEREELSRQLAAGQSLRQIALLLRRNPSSLSRECQRLGRNRRIYYAVWAQKDSFTKSRHPKKPRKLAIHPNLQVYVERRLRENWSPEQIARRIQKEYPLDKTMRISHETIYQHLYVLPRGELKRELLKHLRQSQRFRRRRILTNDDRRGKIPEMISIEERPQEVAERSVPGHWEGDLLVGPSHRSALGTLVERQTRLVLLVPLTQKDATSVREAFAKEIRRLPQQLAKTLTYDQGTEMTEHKKFTMDTKMQVYFAHPHSPWERGTCENTNGLLRQYFPKGIDFAKVSLQEIRKAEKQLNTRPRKTLDWETPSEAFHRLLR
jgi:IS30 family transposase